MENQLLFLLLGNGLSAEVRRGNWRWESCREEGDTVALPGAGTAEETTLMHGWLFRTPGAPGLADTCVGGQAQSPRVQGAATGPQDTSANGPPDHCAPQQEGDGRALLCPQELWGFACHAQMLSRVLKEQSWHTMSLCHSAQLLPVCLHFGNSNELSTKD